MLQIDDAIVEQAAKELAEMDGREWSIEFIPVRPGERIRLTLSPAERHAYLKRAHGELSRRRDPIDS